MTVERRLEEKAASDAGTCFMGRPISALTREQLMGALIIMGELYHGAMASRLTAWREAI